jgi:Papain-like cysteine protease AvrRpt2
MKHLKRAKALTSTLVGSLVTVSTWAALLGYAPIADAYRTCQTTLNGELCTSEVDFATFTQEAFQTQLATQWCWAASISMIFSYYGHPVSQERIVSEVYGSPVNMPAQAGVQMAELLNRDWTDDFEEPFSARLTGAYDAFAGVYALTNDQIIHELDNDRPLLYGNLHHAMVITSIQYYVLPSGPDVVAVGVFDPWPGNGAHGLTPQEMTPAHLGGEMSFVATALISDVVVTGPTGNSGDGGGGGSVDLLLAATLLIVLVMKIARASGEAYT